MIRYPALENMRLWRHSKTVAYSEQGFKYYHFVNAEDENAFNVYISQCKELALYDTGVTAEYGDRLITLSTCEYSRQNGRMVVVAKKIGFALFGGGRK